MGKLSAQNQMYIGIALIAVIAIAVIMLAIVPVFHEAATRDQEIATEMAGLAEAEGLLARRQSAKAQSAANEVELMDIANRLPDSPQLPSVIIEIQDVANAAGVSLEGITPSEMTEVSVAGTQELAGYSSVQLTLLLRGDWADHIDFLHRIARLDRGVRVVSCAYTGVPETDDTKFYVDANVVIEVYVLAGAVTDKSPGVSESQGATATVPAP